jgi:hypothetical protein
VTDRPWVWLAVTDDGGTALSTPGGEPAGFLRTWPHDADHPAHALRCDRRLVAGGADHLTWLSLALGPPLAFDDPIVSGALRRRLAQPWPGAVSTLLVDWARIGGAVTAGPDAAAVADDPFEAAFPRRLLRIEPGLLGPVPAPVGPGITRYGSGNPWPWDRYAGQVS